jgi:dTDP-glucose 4,6-dehydratase
LPAGRRKPQSTVPPPEDDTIAAAVRPYTPLPSDDGFSVRRPMAKAGQEKIQGPSAPAFAIWHRVASTAAGFPIDFSNACGYFVPADADCSWIVVKKMIVITGGAGFIGGNFVLDWLSQSDEPVVNLDKLTYAGNLDTLRSLAGDARHIFVHGDIGDRELVLALLQQHKPRAIVNFAAESHVDRSIHDAGDFIHTNIVGTYNLLESARAYWLALPGGLQPDFRFVHVSTDEVYGTLERDAPPFRETNPQQPNSPYAASKAASDHLVRAWHHTYRLPVVTTNCSNNYGPFQFPEKLIPLIIFNAVNGKPLPIYGDGRQVRDWLYVKDHCAALRCVLATGKPGETYNIGGWNEKPNIEVVRTVCTILDELRPRQDGRPYAGQIEFVKDRPGHDRRYAIDASKIERELNWKPAETFESGIRRTVRWYLDNTKWVDNVASGAYRNWIAKQYGTV